MKKGHFMFFVIILLFANCTSVKRSGIETTGNIKDIAIHAAISDFINNCKLYKQDSVFDVSYRDTVYTTGTRIVTDNFSESFRDKIYEDLLVVNISGSDYKFLLSSKVKIGSKSYLPSRYLEKDGKLFYWYDDDYPMTEEMLAIMQKYGILVNDRDDEIVFLDNWNNDSKKSAYYYFCKNDLSIFKRIIKGGFKRHHIPKIKCRQ